MRRWRILLVTQSYHPVHGGIGEHVRHLGLALTARGHEVDVLTAGPPPEAGELPGLRVHRIGRRVQVPSNGSRATIALHPLFRREVRKLLRHDYDLIQIHSPLEPFLPWAVLREATVPCIGTFHNSGPLHWGYRYFSTAMKPLVRRLRIRTAVSRCAAEFVGRHFPGEYLLVPNGVDPDRFHGNGRTPAADRMTILFVGRLEPRKGLDILIDAVAEANRRLHRRLGILVVGDGSLRTRLLQKAGDQGVDLDWRGQVGVDEIAGCYREADLFAAPALYGESFGIVLLEALASGLPVLASKIEGFTELLQGCPAAHLVRPGSVSEVALGLERILGLIGDRRVGEQARSFAQEFAWERVAPKMEGVFAEALHADRASVVRVNLLSHRELGFPGEPSPQQDRIRRA